MGPVARAGPPDDAAFDDLAADIYWIRAVVHYGSERRSPAAPNRYGLLYPLLDMTTTLDPNFDVAARLGAIFLSEGVPGRAGPSRPGDRPAREGHGAQPDAVAVRARHRLRHYWWLKDYTAAARYFDRASALPGAPNWLKHAWPATTLLVGGDRDAARRLWTRTARYRRRGLAARAPPRSGCCSCARSTRSICSAGESTQAATRLGRAPATGRRSSPPGRCPASPVDPAGVPYAIGPDGRIALGDASPLSPLPTIGVH